jgi:hypothetical protein
MEPDEKGRMAVRTVGMEGVQRDGLNYEFGIVGEMDQDHNLIITKTRVKFLDNAVIHEPDRTLGEKIRAWLESGKVEAEKPVVESKPILVAEVSSEEAENQPEKVNRIYDLADKVKDWLQQHVTEGNFEKALSATNQMCSFKFDSNTMWEIDDEYFDDFRLFARGELVKTLKADGLVK